MWRSWRPTRPRPSPACMAGCSGSRSPCAIPASTGAAWRRRARLLDRFLDAELARHRLPPDRLVLVGFSQGTMMALHAGLRRASAPAGIVGLLGPSCRPRASERDSSPPAGPADPWRGRRPDSDRRRCTSAARRWPRQACRSSGTCGRASAMASIPRASSWPVTSSRRCCADALLASARTRKMRDFQAQCADRGRLHIADTDG